jgi:hypothetical protein
MSVTEIVQRLDEDTAPKQAAAATDGKPVPAPVTPPQLGEILDAVVGFLCRWVVFQYSEQAIASALWIVHTWVIDAFDFTPYLHVFSAEKRSGKSRLLDVLELLVKNPWRGGGETEAVLFRKIKAKLPTLLSDEIDTVFHATKNDGMDNILRMFNLGFTRGYIVSRCVGTNTKFEIEEFDPFCPKALCGIGRCLPDTVADRALPIELVRQSSEEKAERFRVRDARKLVAGIRTEIQAWAMQPGLVDNLRAARPHIPADMQDRQEEICEPLIAIADLAGGKWPETGRAALVKLCAQEEDASIGVKLLTDLKRIFDETGADRLPTIDILNKLVAIEDDRPWAAWWLDDLKHDKPQKPATKLAKMLKRYKTKEYPIKARVIRVGDETPRGYERADLEPAWERYLPSLTQKAATSATSATYEGENVAPKGDVAASSKRGATQFSEGKSKNVAAVAAVAPLQGMRGETAKHDCVTYTNGRRHLCEDCERSWKAMKTIYPGDWIRLYPDEGQPHWLDALRQAIAKPCEVCEQSLAAEPYMWFHLEDGVAQCPACREEQWWDDGYEIDEFGNPSCWSHEHSREERIAEREHHCGSNAGVWLKSQEGQAWLRDGNADREALKAQFRSRRAGRRAASSMKPGEFLAEATRLFNAKPATH